MNETENTLYLERSVLGALMANNSACDDVSGILIANDFASRVHREVFQVVQNLADLGEPFDAVILTDKVKSATLSDLAGMQKDVISPANAVLYAKRLRERSRSRALEQAGFQISQLAHSDRPLLDRIDEAQVLVQGLTTGAADGGAVHVKNLLPGAIDSIDQGFLSEDTLTGVPTGFIDLDKITTGLQASDLIIIAGRPSMGKTTLAMNIAEHAGIKSGIPVAVFSMEMSEQQLIKRMLSSIGHIDQTKIRTGKLADEDWPKLTSAVSALSEARIYIDDTAALTASDLRARARKLVREYGIGLFIVDYLQLMRGPGENRVQEITKISGSLKALAKELNVPVVALSQLSRAVTNRPDKRPTIADLRDSGSIEQDADLILLIHRDEVYNKDSRQKGLAEVIVGKHRNGPTGEILLTFLGKHIRFENYTGCEISDIPEPMQERWSGGFDYQDADR